MMHDETRRRLDRALRRDRLRRIGLGVLVMVAIACVGVWTALDTSEARSEHAGRVEAIAPTGIKGPPGEQTRVSVLLDDGRHVTVVSGPKRPVQVGERVRVIEHAHRSGRTTFSW